jgi:hypothetical protein
MMRKSILAMTILIAATLPAMAPDDDLKRVADALAAGRAAHKPAQRAAAARILDGLGAHPAEGGEDYATVWRGGGPRNAAVRERLLGPAYRRIVIESQGSARFEQAFLAGRLARVAVAPVRSAPFRLQVSGDQGQSYCPDGARACEWVPVYTQRFQVKIDNRGLQPTEFFVVMQ